MPISALFNLDAEKNPLMKNWRNVNLIAYDNRNKWNKTKHEKNNKDYPHDNISWKRTLFEVFLSILFTPHTDDSR